MKEVDDLLSISSEQEKEGFQEMNNAHGLPKTNGDGVDQQDVVALMQAQIDVQKESIAKHETMIQDLISQVRELKTELNEVKNGKNVEKNVELDWASSSLIDQPSSGQSSTLSLSIADMVKETAEKTIAQSGFVYDENSGLYYDKSSGLYYDSARSLYYNGFTKTYYTYDLVTQQYVLHSQLPSSEPDVRKNIPKKSKVDDKKCKVKPTTVKIEDTKKETSVKVKEYQEIEDGELSSSSSGVSIIEQDSASDSDSSHGTVIIQDDEEFEPLKDQAQEPCIRAIVIESDVPELKKGFLFVVTCMGGTIGREGSHHTILIPDPILSKNHAEITYDFDEVSITGTDTEESKQHIIQKKYFIIDAGSQNGTFLNGSRLSIPLTRSDPYEILHGSTLKVGGTSLLLHIHVGLLTCGHCEPGLIMAKEPMYSGVLSNSKKKALARKQLMSIRRKYGLGRCQPEILPSSSASYNDRAKERRIIQGSDNPYEKTEIASIHEAIKEDNKGFKMMAKMGWSAGESLGQTGSSGIREPVKIEARLGRAGLGINAGVHDHSPPPPPSHRSRQKNFHSQSRSRREILEKTMERFISVEPTLIETHNPTKPQSSSSKEVKSMDIVEID